jgi:hypothetical protein
MYVGSVTENPFRRGFCTAVFMVAAVLLIAKFPKSGGQVDCHVSEGENRLPDRHSIQLAEIQTDKTPK